MIVVNYYRTAIELNLMLDRYNRIPNISFVSTGEAEVKYREGIVVVIGAENLRRKIARTRQVHLYDHPSNAANVTKKIQKIKHYFGFKLYKNENKTLVEDRCKKLSNGLAKSMYLREQMNLKQALKLRQTQER